LLRQFILTSGREFLLRYQADLTEQPEPLTKMLTETMVWAVGHVEWSKDKAVEGTIGQRMLLPDVENIMRIV